MSYSNSDITGYAQSQGWYSPNGGISNPWGVYSAAQRYGVSADQLDQAFGLSSGTSANWINGQGFRPLSGQGPGPTNYGYGTAPGQTGLGYYEQQTPAGSFAASDFADLGPQQYSQAQGYSNPYLGMMTPGIGQQQSVMPWAQQMLGYATGSNPYLGMQSQQSASVGSNPYGMGNPYLGQAIDAASADATRNFQNSVMPGLDQMDQASGSFGNTGVQALKAQAYNDLGKNLGNIASGMRMQDYTQQQGLAENALNRQQQNNQYNSGLSAQDLSRNMGGYYQGQNLGLSGYNGVLNAAQYDTGMGQRNNEFNASLTDAGLGRNAGLAQAQGQFNSSAQNTNSMFNAGQGNQMNMYGAGQRNNMNMFNAGSANNMLNQYRNLQQQQHQFDDTLNWNIDQGNWNRQHTGQMDSINAINQLLNSANLGLGWANQMQNTPLAYLAQLTSIANGAGQNGATTTQSTPYYSDPWSSGLGAWQLISRMFPNGISAAMTT